MNTPSDNANNARLREILARAKLLQPAAVAVFNRGREQPVGFSAWCAWTAAAGSAKQPPLPDDELAWAERAFADLIELR